MKFIAVVLVSAFAAACGTTISQTALNAPPHPMPARDPASVEVFSSGPPALPHIDVAVLQAQQSSGWSTDDSSDMIAQLRARAAEMGCDGVVITGPDNAAVGNRYGTTTLHGFMATCIVFTAAAEPVPAPASAMAPAPN